MKKIMIQIFPVALLAIALFLYAGGVGGRSISVELATADPVAEAIDQARYTTVMLLDRQVDFPQPATEAAENLQELVEANSSEPRYYIELAEVLVALGKFDEAEAAMQRMADNHPKPADGLTKLADFYHQRQMIDKEAATLMRVSEMQKGDEKIATLRGVLQLGDDFLLESVDRVALQRSMRDEKPDDPNLTSELVAALRSSGKYEDALSEADTALDTFPGSRSRFLALKAEVLQQMGRTEEAFAVYDIDFHPVDDFELFDSYLGQLRSAGSYTRFERGLRRDYRLGNLDERGFQRYFLLMRSQRRFADAAKGLDKWMELLEEITAERLGIFADAYAAVGYPVPAWRVAYARYISAGDSGKEDALFQLASLTKSAVGRGLQLGSSSALLLTNKHFDTGPGLLGGLLSLLYNNADTGRKFADLERMSQDFSVNRAYFNLFERFEEEYPESEHLGTLYAGAIDILNSYGRARAAFEMAERFMNEHPDSGRYYEVAESAMKSLEKLRLYDRIEALYKELIARTDQRRENSLNFAYISRLERHYVQQKQLDRSVAFYWDMINAHPEREDMYDRFLSFLSRHRIFAEEMKVYQRAIKQFEKNDYFDKLARWYLRNKRWEEFRELTRDVSEIFNGSELAEYFREHLRMGNVSDSDSIFYSTMYEYANKRFPRNLRFVRGLLNYYSHFKLWSEFDALSMRYFYADPIIRKNWLWRLSARKKLLPEAERLFGGELAATLGTSVEGQLPESPAEMLFLAEAAQWNSYYETAEAPLRSVSAEYPTQADYVEALAKLERSLGKSDEAIKLYTALAERSPFEAKHATAAGEIAIERGDIKAAAGHWLNIIAAKPADSESYLQVASIFWDYYQFDRAAAVLLQGRERLKSPGLYGSKLGAVYESAGNYESAVKDYVKSIVLNWDDYYGREQPMSRLVLLATRKQMDEDIHGAFNAAISGSDNFHTVQAYDDFLNRVQNRDRAIDTLSVSIESFDNEEFLTWLASRFRYFNRPELELRAIERYIEVEGPAVGNLLLLAQFHERQKQLDMADEILLRRVEMTRTDEPEAVPDYVAALHDAANFAWRHEQLDDAYNRWETAARASEDWRRRSQMLELVNRLVLKERYGKAVALLEEMLAADPVSTELFNALAGIYAKREDYQGLAGLYQSGIEAIRKADSLTSDQRKARVRQLRFGMIENLIHLGDITAAVDQYIELINGEYDDPSTIANAYRLAARNSLTERLIGYYRETSEKSFKDHRWNTVLARLAELENDLESADEQWRKAIANEPQRIDLRQALADVLIKRQLFEGAVEQFREIYRLDQRNSFWLNTIAEIQAMAGDIDAAKETLATILENSPNQYSNYFDAARFLVRWNDLAAAAEYMSRGLEVLKKDIYEDGFTQDDLNLFLEVSVKRGEATAAFFELLNLNQLYRTESARDGNARAWQARSGQTMTYNAFTGSFAASVNTFANSKDAGAVAAALEQYLISGDQNRQTVEWVLNSARAMNFTPLVLKADEACLNLYTDKFRDYDFENKFSDMLEYYQVRGMWREAATALEREMARMDMRSFKTTVLGWLSDLYRYGGESEEELGALRRYWGATRGTSLSFGKSSNYARRYLDLLMEAGNDNTLRSVAGNAGAYTGYALNYFLAHERIDLAVICIDAFTRAYGPKWRDSKKLLLDVYAGASPDDLGVYGLPADLMSHKPISRLLGVTLDRQRVLVGDEWYDFLPHYAEYLLREKNGDDIAAWINGVVEESPRSPGAQRLAGLWHVNHERWDDAKRHFALAQQLAPKDPNNYVVIGKMHLRQGDEGAALDEWGKIIGDSKSSATYELYLNTLIEADLLDRAAPAMEEFIRVSFNQDSNWGVLSLISDYVAEMEEAGNSRQVVELLTNIAVEQDMPLEFLSLAYEQFPFAPEQRAVLMSAIIDSARAGEADAELEQRNFIYKNWLDQGIEFALESQLWQQAIDWIVIYEEEGFIENPGWRLGSKQEVMRAKGKALLGLDRTGEAVEVLEHSLDKAEMYDVNSYQEVFSILSQGGAPADGRRIMIRFYRNAISRGVSASNYFTGLAELLFSEGGSEERREATEVLERFVNRVAADAEALRSSARLLEKYDHFGPALRYRRMLSAVAPADYENISMLASSLVESGDRQGAIALFRRLFEEQGVERELLVSAADEYAKLFEGRAAEARDEMSRYGSMIDDSEPHRLLNIYLALAANEMGRARELLDGGETELYEPALLAHEQAEIALKTGDAEGAIEWLQRSIQRDPRPQTVLRLVQELIAKERNEEVLLLFDNYSWQGLNSGDISQVEAMTGLHGKALLAFLNELTDAAIAVEAFDTAISYDTARVEFAHQLGVTVESRNEEIEQMRQEHSPLEPPITIDQSIANNIAGEDR